jgi:hypothetical protein
MSQIASRFSIPRLDLTNGAGVRVQLPLHAFHRVHDLTKWIYASVVPNAALFKINPVSHLLTGCAGTVEGIKVNVASIVYLLAAVEHIDVTASQPGEELTVFHDDAADTNLVKLYRGSSGVDRDPVWGEISHYGHPLPFTGTQTISVQTAPALDTNMRFHLLMGCA